MGVKNAIGQIGQMHDPPANVHAFNLKTADEIGRCHVNAQTKTLFCE